MRSATVLPAAVGLGAVFAAALVVILVAAGAGPLVLAAALAVPVGLALARRPQWGLLALVALAPFDGLLLIAPAPGAASGWKEALALGALLATWLCPPDARGPDGRRLPRWSQPAGALLALGVLSAATVGGTQAIVGLKVGFFYLLIALAWWRCPLNLRERDALVTILMTTGLVCSAVGLWQQWVGDARLNQLGYAYNDVIRFAGGRLRSFSTFEQPFPFGLFIMVVVLVCLPVALQSSARLRNRLFLFALPVYGLGILSSFVRAAVLGLAVGLLYLGITRYRIVLAAIPLAVIAFAMLGGSVVEPTLSSTSLGARTDGWQENLSEVRANPFGVGVGSTGAVADRLEDAVPSVDEVYYPDNTYYKTLYELGVIGLWLLVFLLASAFLSVRRVATTATGEEQGLVDGIAAVVLAAIVAGLVTNYLEIFPLDLVFWALLALAATSDASLLPRPLVAVPTSTGRPRLPVIT